MKEKENTMEPPYVERELFPVAITDNQEICPGVFFLSWKRNKPFIPGQVIKIALDLKIPPRIYSLCSGNQDKNMSIIFDINPDGLLSPKLAAARPGTIIYVSEPYGSFTCDLSPACWIATGTGIAPFYAMLRSGLGANKILIHGARHINRFCFEEEFLRALGKDYIRCCSAEKAPHVFHGRITEYISKTDDLPRDFKYYLCGGAKMVVEVRDILIDQGIPFENILSEIYF